MAKINIKELAKELDVESAELLELASAKLSGGISGVGLSTWFTPEAAAKLRSGVVEALAPLACAVKLTGMVVRTARNPSWCYCRIEGHEGVVPVALPRKLQGKVWRKNIPIERITDATGETTYRYDYRTS